MHHLHSPAKSFEHRASGPSELWGSPSVAHNSGTVTTFSINHEWRMLLIGLLDKLITENSYSGTEAETLVSETIAFELMEDLYNVEASMQTGVIVPFVADPGADWLLCDGSVHSGLDFPDLFAIIPGWLQGTGTDFKVPDLVEKFPLGGTGDLSSPFDGAEGGEEEHTLNINEIPSHRHKLKYDEVGLETGATIVDIVDQLGVLGITETRFTGGSQPHNNMPPFIVLSWYIKT